MSRILGAVASMAVLLFAVPASAGAPAWVEAPPVPADKDASEVLLRDVTIVAADDVWTVGAWTADVSHTLAVHWNGTAWTRVPTPDEAPDGIGEYGLNAVDAVASDDVWAVGTITTPGVKDAPLFLHYDGVTWTEHPVTAEVAGELTDIDLLTADEGWAVGTNNTQPLIMRRTAGQWEQAAVPWLGVPASLSAVYATSPTDAWAVGSQQRNGRLKALILRWNGTQWSAVTLPDPGANDESLSGVAAASATDVWAVGTLCTPVCRSRVLHLAQGIWRAETSSPAAVLTSVVALTPTDVWVFGQSTSPSSTVLDHIEHWDGLRFTVDLTVPPATADPHHPASALSLAAAAVDRGTGTMWAVGWIESTRKEAHALYRN